MNLHRRAGLVVASLAVVSVAAWLWREAARPAGSETQAATALAAPRPAQPPAATPGAPSQPQVIARVDPAQLAAVEAEVARLNREAGEDRRAFAKAGWTSTDAPPPDRALVGLDPKLVREGRENELRLQLASTTPPVELVDGVVAIAEQARETSTKLAAIAALGRMGAPGQAGLRTLVAPGHLGAHDPAREAATSALVTPATQDEASPAARGADR
jgi:hypothetical protein